MSVCQKQYPFHCMTDYIESMIAAGTYQSGQKLPTLRELGEQFELNLDMVRRGIWHLRDRGLLDCRRGSGNFVAARRGQPSCNYRISVMLSSLDPAKTYCAHILLGMQKAALEYGILLESRPDAGIRSASATVPAENALGCDALILLGNYDVSIDTLQLPCPAVGVEMHRMYGGVLSTVALDPINAAELAADYFRQRGLRRVRVVGHGAPLHDFRAEQFLLRWRGMGNTAEYVHIADSPAEVVVPETFDPAEGFLFTGGDSAQFYGAAYRKRTGRTFCQEFTALSIDGKSLILPGYDPIDCIFVDWMGAGRRVLDEAVRRIANPGAAANRIYLDVKLHCGSATPGREL